jgi:hypothetical protein
MLLSILSSQPQPSAKQLLAAALSAAEAVYNSDPGLHKLQQPEKSAGDSALQLLQQELQRARQLCEDRLVRIKQKLQADEASARSSTQSRLNELGQRERRANDANDYKQAKEINDMSSECQKQLPKSLQQLRDAADAAIAHEQQLAADVQAKLNAAASSTQQQLQALQQSYSSFQTCRARAVALLNRQPAWPRHQELLRFELPLQRLTRHLLVTMKWFPRFFVLRGQRLYYSDGDNGHADSKEGTLSFVRSDPAPDGRYCVNLNGSFNPCPSNTCRGHAVG